MSSNEDYNGTGTYDDMVDYIREEISNQDDYEYETTIIIASVLWDGILDMLFTMQCYMIYTTYAMLAVNRYRRLARCSLKGRRGGRR